MPTQTTPKPSKFTLQKTLPSRAQQEREAMVMRETDQWMAEYNRRRKNS